MLLLTVIVMQRDRDDAVTPRTKLPILIPSSAEQQEGLATFLLELGAPQTVRTFHNKDLKDAHKHLSNWQAIHFRAVIALVQALRHPSDSIALEKAISSLNQAYELRRTEPRGFPDAPENANMARSLAAMTGLPPAEALEHFQQLRPGARATKNPGWLLSYELSTALQFARLVLWWTGREFRPALWCQDMRTAFYARALLDPVGGKGIRICPHCSELFIQERPDQSYCSVAHREAYRVARWRAKQKHGATKKTKARRENVTKKAR
jgi:hypothetical protein